jgi:hypothetical protein
MIEQLSRFDVWARSHLQSIDELAPACDHDWQQESPDWPLRFCRKCGRPEHDLIEEED